jgi:hypothetical protein
VTAFASTAECKQAMAYVQDKFSQKKHLVANGVAVVEYAEVTDEVRTALKETTLRLLQAYRTVAHIDRPCAFSLLSAAHIAHDHSMQFCRVETQYLDVQA